MQDDSIMIYPATTESEIAEVRKLFVEYANSLGFSLCFQGFDKELESLPGQYTPPAGRLFLSAHNSRIAGCIALKPLDPTTCEMKRLYLRDEFRGLGLGRIMALKLIEEARKIGYRTMMLDTIEDKMKSAVSLYRSLGFIPCPPYYHNPIEGVLYMELKL